MAVEELKLVMLLEAFAHFMGTREIDGDRKERIHAFAVKEKEMRVVELERQVGRLTLEILSKGEEGRKEILLMVVEKGVDVSTDMVKDKEETEAWVSKLKEEYKVLGGDHPLQGTSLES